MEPSIDDCVAGDFESGVGVDVDAAADWRFDAKGGLLGKKNPISKLTRKKD